MGIAVSTLFLSHIPSEKLIGKPVVITGCDTGFGYELSLKLVSRGLTVYSGCYTEGGRKNIEDKVKENPQLYGKGKLKALQLDVSKDKSVAEFAKTVIANEPEGIFALVNNAGVALSGPFEMQDFDQHKALFEVNYFGPVRMMRAFLPSLRNFIRNGSDLHPRIVNVASVAGRVIAPALSAYCASKHAIKALSEVIRMEVKPFGIKVNIIEPFFAKTPILSTDGIDRLEENYKKCNKEIQESYGSVVEKFRGSHSRLLSMPLTMTPEYVVAFMENAVVAVSPPHRFLIGLGAWIVVLLRILIPSWLSDAVILLVNDDSAGKRLTKKNK